MSIYTAQRAFFRRAYEAGEHPWPTTEPSAFVRAFVRRNRHQRRNGRAAGRHSRRMLDIGCGEGRHAHLFARAGFHAVGLDAEPLAIRRAVRLRPSARQRPAFVVGDALRLPFKAGSFDVVVDYGCLHHIRKRDDPAYRRALAALLRDGGYLLLSCFSTRFRHEPGERRHRNWLVHRGHYDRFFRRQDFPALFGRAFTILRIAEERHGLQAFYHVLMRKRPAREGATG